MIIVRFTERGYTMWDDENPEMTDKEESTKHEFLFQYLNKDLSLPTKLLKNFMSKAMNLSTFELTGKYATQKDVDKIYDALINIHPFYKYDRIEGNQDTLFNAIGFYFNTLLYEKFLNGTKIEECDEEWYEERFNALIKCLELEEKDNHYEEFYEFYSDAISSEGDEMELLRTTVTKGFNIEMRTQKYFKQMLFWIVDLTSILLNKLSTSQREWYFGIFFGKALYRTSEMQVTKRLTLNIKYYDKDKIVDPKTATELNQQRDSFDGIYELFNNQYTLTQADEKILDAYASVISQKIPRDEFLTKENEEYEIISLRQLLFLQVKKMIERNQKIRRCRNCNMYFVVTNLNQRYCDRIGDGGLSCTEVGPARSFQKKKENDPALALYSKAKNTRRMRVINKIPGWDKNTLAKWKDEARAKLELVRAGELNINDYEKWLKK